jgi:hypothetical protein
LEFFLDLQKQFVQIEKKRKKEKIVVGLGRLGEAHRIIGLGRCGPFTAPPRVI